MLSRGRKGTAGTRSAHWSLGVIRYVVTRCLHGPREPMCPPFWAQVELRKCLFTRQPTMTALVAVAARPYTRYTTREPMDRVRRCCTGEMFQPTRLKGQLTPSCLAACVRGCALRALCAPVVLSSSPHRLPITARRAGRCPRSASVAARRARSFLSASFFRRFVVYSIATYA